MEFHGKRGWASHLVQSKAQLPISVGTKLLGFCYFAAIFSLLFYGNITVQVRTLVERKFECPLFDEFLEGDFFHFKIRILLQIKIHELNKAMVEKYFHKLNILLNK